MAEENEENTETATKEASAKPAPEASKEKSSSDAKADDGEFVLEFTAQKLIQKAEDGNIVEISQAPSAEASHPNMSSSFSSPTHSAVNINALSEILSKSSHEVDVLKVQMSLITTFVTEAKVLEIEMNKLIKAMYAKYPDAKPYLLRMKKMLQDHAKMEKALELAKNSEEHQDESSLKKVS